MENQTMCEMHNCLRPLMRLCRWAGLLPIEGLNKDTTSKLRFNIKSPYVVYHFATIFCQIMLAGLSVYYFLINDLNLDRLTLLIFYLTSLMSAILILRLALRWPYMIKRASDIENSVTDIRISSKSSVKYSRIANLVMILALLEHISSVVFKVKLAMSCERDLTIGSELVEKYFIPTAPHVFTFTTYAHWKAIIYEVANIQSTFLWNLTDVMTMCASLYLCSYFQDLNKIIEQRKEGEVIRWEEIRIHYSHLVKLVKIVDFNFCHLILLSFFTNLFFICVQLFKLMNHNYPVISGCKQENVKLSIYSVEHSIYYTYSFLFLFIRATATSLLAANVNTVARKSIYTLTHVPQSEYTIEVQRFIRQIRYTTTAISGVLFDVTRETILAVIGTVFKYELVLLQFSLTTYEAIQ